MTKKIDKSTAELIANAALKAFIRRVHSSEELFIKKIMEGEDIEHQLHPIGAMAVNEAIKAAKHALNKLEKGGENE